MHYEEPIFKHGIGNPNLVLCYNMTHAEEAARVRARNRELKARDKRKPPVYNNSQRYKNETLRRAG